MRMKFCIETDSSLWRWVRPSSVLSVCSLLLLPGCGLWGYFSAEPDPAKSTELTSRSPAVTQDGIDPSSDLAQLELYLLHHSPALDLFKESQESAGVDPQDAWLPGARVIDSAALEGDRGLSLPGDRSLAIDWRPSSILDGEWRQRQRDARQSIARARLRETQGKLLRLLREEWAELWYQQQARQLTLEALGDLRDEIRDDLSDDRLEIPAVAPIQRVALKSRWDDRLAGIEEEVLRTQIRINSLLGRSSGSILPRPVDAGDVRFSEVDRWSDRRLHPRVILAEEELILASAKFEQEQGNDWPDVVFGARSSYDRDAPVTGSSGREDSWMVTLGVEIPLGLQAGDQRLSAARSDLGSARFRQILSRRSIEDEIAAARAQLLASNEAIDALENEVIAHIEEAGASWNAVAVADQGESRWRIVEKLLEARIGCLRAVSDRARARVSLVDLLGLERPGARGALTRLR
ncbi:MAG: TolC family protein [Planctomycetota bacterium]|nr:TolC family protein [Planctomycetota bacterium]